jgi:hypothetical protein
MSPDAGGADTPPPDGPPLGPLILPEHGFGGVDGTNVYQFPLVTNLVGVTWEVDAAKATIESRPPPSGNEDSMFGTWALVTPRVSGHLEIAAVAAGVRAMTAFEITAYDPAEIAIGRRRYYTPDSPSATRVACASCHAKPDGPDHSPLVNESYSDAQILSAITTGDYGDGSGLSIPHTWDVTPAEAAGLVGYLRSLTPRGF